MKKLLAVMLLAFATQGWAADPKVVGEARSLMDQGRAQDAYELLLPRQSELAGDVDYDLLLGVAALDSGHPNEAVFALERVLAVNPNHARARAEIARAYFAMGEIDASKAEFEAVKRQNPPQPVVATIQKFLEAIEQAKASERTSVRGHLEVSLGYDTNVNSATGDSTVAVPAFGGAIATLSNNGTKQEDWFRTVGGSLSIRHPLDPEWAVFGGLGFSQRWNFSKDVFDTGSLDGNLGASFTRGDNSFSLAAQAQSFDVDNARYRTAQGFTAQWLHNLSQTSQLSAYVQYSDLTYPTQSPRDADRYVGGVAYARALGGLYAPVVYASGYLGEERTKNGAFGHLGHEVKGLRAGGEMKFSQVLTGFASVSAEFRDYKGVDPLFLVTRQDRQYDFRLGVNYQAAPKWSVIPQFSYTRNDANTAINDYDRAVLSVNVRRDFN